jgi:hypothetical protein
MAINRHVHSALWTQENDALLRKLEAAGASTIKIAARLGITSRSVQRRSHHLLGLPSPLQPYQEKLRRKSTRLREQKNLRSEAALKAMRAAIARGVPRNEAIMQAKKRGARPQAIANEVGLDRQSIYRITVLEVPAEQAAKAKRRKEAGRRERAALTAMRTAIAKGTARESAIIQARKAGATYAAIGRALGLTRQRVHQIILMQE